METCRKNLKEFSLYRHLNFQEFVLKFIGARKSKGIKFKTTMEKEIFEQPKVIENLINTFIEENNLNGKNTYVFVTSGGSGSDGSFKDLKNSYPEINFISSKRLRGNEDSKDYINWIK